MGDLYVPVGPEDYTFEPVEVLNMMDDGDRGRLAELRNMELQNKIEILRETEVITPRLITQNESVYEAKVEIIVEFATISKPILDTIPQTDV